MTIARLKNIAKRERYKKSHKERLSRRQAGCLPVRSKSGKMKFKDGWKIVKPPASLNIVDCCDSNKIIKEINHITFESSDKIFIDLSELKSITPYSALILAAEIDRCQKVTKSRIWGTYPNDFGIMLMLRSMGFFKLIQVRDPLPRIRADHGHHIDIFPMETSSDRRAYNEKLKALIFGSDQKSIINPLTQKIKTVIDEAATNVTHHAYEDENSNRWIPGNFWAVGFRNTKQGTLDMIFYDQGIGIPQSLPKKWPLLKELFYGKQDAELIREATALSVTRTNEVYRGKGLKQMKELVTNYPSSFLTIISRKGSYTYTHDGKENLAVLDNDVPGTLVAWHLANVEEIKLELKNETKYVA